MNVLAVMLNSHGWQSLTLFTDRLFVLTLSGISNALSSTLQTLGSCHLITTAVSVIVSVG